jgi:hypothetical protein
MNFVKDTNISFTIKEVKKVGGAEVYAEICQCVVTSRTGIKQTYVAGGYSSWSSRPEAITGAYSCRKILSTEDIPCSGKRHCYSNVRV